MIACPKFLGVVMKENAAFEIDEVSMHCHVGDVLAEIMRLRRIDVATLSGVTGIPVPTLNRLKSGKNTNPTLATLLPIANYFGISINQLIGKESMLQVSSLAAEKKSIDSCIPLVSIRESVTDVDKKKYPIIRTSADVSDAAFAIAVKDAFITSEFPENAILIFDPSLKPNHRDYVIVRLSDLQKPILRQLLIDGDDYYFKPLSRELGEMVLSKKHQIEAVLVQAIMNYRE